MLPPFSAADHCRWLLTLTSAAVPVLVPVPGSCRLVGGNS